MSAPVAAIVPAKDEADRVAATVTALRALPEVGPIVVVDDGSSDDTAQAAEAAGAVVVRHARNRGKSAALTTGVARLAEIERAAAGDDEGRGSEHRDAERRGDEHVLLFVDADLASSASALAPLLVPVLDGTADLTVANIPAGASSQGGGRVVRLARGTIEAMTGQRIEQPLNGMRCLTREAYRSAAPLAPGWGVEAAMLVDVLRAGLRVQEVPVEITHRRTGTDLRGRLHRARQLRDVAIALLLRRWEARRGGARRGGVPTSSDHD